MKVLKQEKGAALVEFALVVTLLMLLVFGIIEFGRILHTQLVVTSAAREGARKAVVTGDENDIETAISNATASLNATVSKNTGAKDGSAVPGSSDVVWWYYEKPSGNAIGNPVYVYVKGRVDLVVPLISNIIGTPKALQSNAMMRIESL